jgi:hypothetical protein
MTNTSQGASNQTMKPWILDCTCVSKKTCFPTEPTRAPIVSILFQPLHSEIASLPHERKLARTKTMRNKRPPQQTASSPHAHNRTQTVLMRFGGKPAVTNLRPHQAYPAQTNSIQPVHNFSKKWTTPHERSLQQTMTSQVEQMCATTMSCLFQPCRTTKVMSRLELVAQETVKSRVV